MLDFIAALTASYTVQLCAFASACFLLGALTPPRIVIGVLVAIGMCVGGVLIVGSSFDLGETYRYSAYYKRNFFLFGDEISLALVAAFLAAVSVGRVTAIAVIGAGLLIAGGKIALAMAVGGIWLIWWADRGALRLRNCLSGIAIAAALYSAANAASLLAPMSVRSTPVAALNAIGDYPLDWFHDARGACTSVEHCVATQVGDTLADRSLGIIAGFWMTLQGGFAGERYPASAEAFSDLMASANPFGVNTAFGVERTDWARVGRPENVLANVGSAYGLVGLGLALWVLSWMTLISWGRLRDGGPSGGSALAAFVIVMTLINQFHAYAMPGNYVFAVLLVAFGSLVGPSLAISIRCLITRGRLSS